MSRTVSSSSSSNAASASVYAGGWLGHGAVLIAMVLVGSGIPVSKILAEDFPVFTLGVLRYGVSAAILWAVVWLSRDHFPRLTRKDARFYSFQAFCSNVVFSVGMLYGLRYTTGASASVISGTMPAMIGILGMLVFRDKIPLRTWLAIVLSVVGLLAVAGGHDGHEVGSQPILGNALVLLAVMGEAVFLLMSGRTAGHSPMVVSALVCTLGGAMMLPFAVGELIMQPEAFPTITWMHVVCFLHYAVAVTVIGYILWFVGVRRIGSTDAASYAAVPPVVALGCSVLFLGESITLQHGFGCAVVVLAILIAARKPKKQQDVGGADDATQKVATSQL
jgi:drug/metabolite transporter (DMT)-like permease